MSNTESIKDSKYHFHPNANARAIEQNGPFIIEKGSGIYVEDNNGKQYIEAMAGLWGVAVGFGEKRLADAAYKQMLKLPFSHTFAQRSHPPVIELAENLIQLAPVPMSKVHFTNSGSEANDTIIKTLWYRSNAMGQPKRTKIIGRKRGYHGLTIATASATGIPVNHASFGLPLPGFLHLTCPHYYREALEGESEADFVKRLANELEELIIKEDPNTIAAFIGEPIMGAGGVVVPPKGYWQAMQQVLQKYDILLIADEVICGFGRTGKMFGCQTFDIKPDIMTVSKQISSSYLPISAFMVNDKVYQPVADESVKRGIFAHGYTTSGHPVAAAVAVENLKIIAEQNLVQNAQTVGDYLQNKLRELQNHPLIGEIRGVGLLAGIELVFNKDDKSPLNNAACLKNGLIVRNIGDTLALCPPLIITQAQIDDVMRILKQSLDEVLQSI